MNLFDKARINSKKEINSKCFICEKVFIPDPRNTNRGWGLFCSKSCSTKWRNKSKTKIDLRNYNLKKLGI
jgi:hypothetical protein